MELDNIIGTTSGTSAATNSAQNLAQNFDTFLTLLTTQLQNQDPLEPMSSQEFTQQLVQFSSVEQSIATNKNLESLLSLSRSTIATNAVSYLGHDATALSASNGLKDGNAQWSYVLDQDVKNVTLTITDAAGKLVFVAGDQPVSTGEHNFTWDGKDNSGKALPDGIYTLRASALDGEDVPFNPTAFIKGKVESMSLENDEPSLVINGVTVKLSDIRDVSS